MRCPQNYVSWKRKKLWYTIVYATVEVFFFLSIQAIGCKSCKKNFFFKENGSVSKQFRHVIMYAYYTYCTLYYSSPFHTLYFPLTAILLAYNLSLCTSLRFSEYPRFADLSMHFIATARLLIEVRIRSARTRRASQSHASRASPRPSAHALPKPVVISKLCETHSTHQSWSLSFKLSRARTHFPPQFTSLWQSRSQ